MGTAQLTFIADKAVVAAPPRSAQALLAFAQTHPGRELPQTARLPRDNLRQATLLELAPERAVLEQPVTPEAFWRASAPPGTILDRLHPVLWRAGKAFPQGIAEMHRMLADGELNLSLTFNPNEAANPHRQQATAAECLQLRLHGRDDWQRSFLAIPAMRAQRWVRRSSPTSPLTRSAGARRTSPWGDGSVLDPARLPEAMRAAMQKNCAWRARRKRSDTGRASHASWVEAIEAEWLKRYGAQ